MAACGQQDKLELITSVADFFRRTGIVADYRELEWLGFKLDNYIGIFSKKYLPQLLEFCEANPEYHIVTSTEPGRLVNAYIPGKKTYNLAKGDPSSNLVHNRFLDPRRPLIDEDLTCKALTMINESKGGW